MLSKIKTLSAVTLSASLLAAPVLAGDFKRITTEAEYMQKIVGKKLVTGKDFVKIEKNGKMKGKFGGAKLVGAWKWQQGYWCRTIRLGGKDRGSDCQVVMVSDTQMYSIRKQGKGDKSPIFTIK